MQDEFVIAELIWLLNGRARVLTSTKVPAIEPATSSIMVKAASTSASFNSYSDKSNDPNSTNVLAFLNEILISSYDSQTTNAFSATVVTMLEYERSIFVVDPSTLFPKTASSP